MSRKGWSDLSPDLLREIAGRLHVAGDFVSFHAVCKPWRNSRDLVSRTTATTNQFLPWLLVPTESSSPLKLRCIFSKSSYRVMPPPYPRRKNWVCSADGAAVGYLTVQDLRPTLHDPITGAVTDLPLFPYKLHWEENPCGIVYGDGTTLLYESGGRFRFRFRFRAALLLLRPGDKNWTLFDRTIEATGNATYHGGRILVPVEGRSFRVIMPDGGHDMLIPRPGIPGEHMGSCPMAWDSYILESHGELLWVVVLFRWYCWSYPSVMLVSVHALEETSSAPEKMLWVRKEGHYLADRVLFLGSPNSFAVDASLLGAQGGCAYFVCNNCSKSGVFRYNFLDDKTEFIEGLPLEWNIEKCVWLVPQPTITPIQEITIGRKLGAQKLKERRQRTAPITSPSRTFHIERQYEHSFRVLVRNLPLEVEQSQLQLFFSKHGKVSSIEIIYHKNTNTSEGIVKMATMHAYEDDALAALDKLVFDGCSLEVTLVNNKLRRRRRKAAYI